MTTREIIDGINRSEITPRILQLSFDEDGNLKVATEVDSAGLAKDSTVEAIKDQTDKLQFDSNNNLLVGVNADAAGLAKDTTVAAIKGVTDKFSFDQLNYLNTSYLNRLYDDSITLDKPWSVPPNAFVKFSELSISSGGTVYGKLVIGNGYLYVPAGVCGKVKEGGIVILER